MSTAVRGWPWAKRVLHWGAAVCVAVALLAPKPEDGAGLLHIAAGSLAAALLLARLGGRLLGDVRPRLRDGLRIGGPSPQAAGPRAYAMPAGRLGRLLGFALLLAVPAAATLGVTGITAGEDSALLEAHEALGTAIIFIASAHVILSFVFAALARFDVLGVSLWRAGPVLEGGRRGMAGLAVGVLVAVGLLTYLWGPYDIASRAARLQESDSRGAEAAGDDD
jgi:hypothetical protein